MAVRRTSREEAAGSPEVQRVAELIVQREQEQEERRLRRARRHRQQQRRSDRESVARMHRSVEVIKWCIVAICTVWVASFIISIFVLMRVHSRVVEIEGQVKRIQHVMEHPFASAGERLGGDLDTRLKEWFQLPEPEPAED